jgi:hypothetical protein
MKTRLTPILLVLAIILTAMLSRFVGGSDYILAETTNFAYRFFYCPYNRAPYTNPNYRNLYSGYPAMRFPYPSQYPLPEQYPCPCTIPPVDSLLLDNEGGQ